MITMESVSSHFEKYGRLYIISGGLLLVLLLVAFFFQFCENWGFNRDIDKQKQNVNKTLEEGKQNINGEMQNANLIKANIENLKIKEIQAEAEVNVKTNEYINAKRYTDNRRIIANTQLGRTQAIENANYANKMLKDALDAQCRAFPESSDCPH
jgi:preprotein translocase subunit SecF